jgi:hypothetical protein
MYIVIDKKNEKTAVCKTIKSISTFLGANYLTIWKRVNRKSLKSKHFDIFIADFVALKGKKRGKMIKV